MNPVDEMIAYHNPFAPTILATTHAIQLEQYASNMGYPTGQELTK